MGDNERLNLMAAQEGKVPGSKPAFMSFHRYRGQNKRSGPFARRATGQNREDAKGGNKRRPAVYVENNTTTVSNNPALTTGNLLLPHPEHVDTHNCTLTQDHRARERDPRPRARSSPPA